MSTKFGSKGSPHSLHIDSDINGSVAAEDDVDEPQKNLCQIWTVEGIELKLTEAVKDRYAQVSTKFDSDRSPSSLDIDLEIEWSGASEDDVDEP